MRPAMRFAAPGSRDGACPRRRRRSSCHETIRVSLIGKHDRDDDDNADTGEPQRLRIGRAAPDRDVPWNNYKPEAHNETGEAEKE
jgi:hypothetical protein